MRLADWLKAQKVARTDFAERIGVSPSLVTQLCAGIVWPGKGVAERIAVETSGDVTANDFLPEGTPTAPAAESGEAA